MWKKNKNNTSYVSTISLARSCRGVQCARLMNQNRNTCVTFGVYEKVDEKEAVEKYGITPVDTKWVDTAKA